MEIRDGNGDVNGNLSRLLLEIVFENHGYIVGRSHVILHRERFEGFWIKRFG